MSDILKFGSAIRLAQLASDPSGVENGVLYYNTVDNVVKQYINGGWQQVPSSALTLLGLALNDGEIVVGNASNVSAAVDTDVVGDVQADHSTGLTIKSGVIVNGQISASAAIDLSKLAALTASRALQSNGSGVISASSVTSTELGYLSGVTSAVQTQLNAKQNTSEKGQPNGYASLDGSGKVPVAQLPNSIMEYQGTWNASTNSPTLADGVGSIGDVYRVSVAGTQNLGSGSISFDVGDYAILNASLVWEKADTTDAVSSVNGATGAVTVNAINQLTGEVTAGPASGSQSVSATLSNSAVIGKVLTGYSASAGTVSASDSILSAIQKIDANDQNKATKALDNLASVAINTSLLPASNNSIDAGSTSLMLRGVYTGFVRSGEDANVSFTGDTTSGSAVIAVANTSGLAVSMQVSGAGIPDNATISSIVTNTSITISANATATATGVSLLAQSSGIYRTGDKTGSSLSGPVIVRSGNTVDNISGSVLVRTGNATGTGKSGSLTLSTGSTNSGNSGSITISAGLSTSGSRGNVSLFGSSIIMGGGQGGGSIQPQLNIIPSTNNTLNLGSSSFKFANAYLGNSLVLEDPGAGTNSVTVQAASGSSAYTVTLPSSAPGSTQAVFMDSSGNLSTSAVATASAGDINETSFTGLANNTANQTITGLAFANATVRSARIQLSIALSATSNQYAVYDLMAIQRGSDWQMTSSYTGDSISGLSFDITAAGQVRASIGNISGFSSATIKFRAQTTSV